ncbi:ABC transporter ATP-binding protein [Salinibacterium sp. UTAS2018]|uniref:ABC transporter ATP-binding protein n=1 Tax=Salinibacterium sp. UTAS2018 TaxID=2508880 RepID=UPI00100982B7|nr:ABC transporter ATP-binding protein [Salinibacterium sp. UTAS2018]QAV70932.1 ABC transporter ATP-binding protein [Salinibacterium sp. UTAS2018]
MAIEVEHLSKNYGKFVAVKDLSFNVEPGTVFAFIGSNGAGKSTAIGCITTTLAPTSGEIRVAGYDVATDAHAVRAAIGAVFQTSLLDPLLTVKENLIVRAGFYGLTRKEAIIRIGRLSELVKLHSFLDRRYGLLSGGEKRRADIARALIHNPSIVFLDEPTAGLDPQSREHIWAAIEQLRATHGTTVFLTTHYMEETERANNVCILDKGEIVAEGTPADLRQKYSSSVLTVRSSRPVAILDECRRRGLEPSFDDHDIVIPLQSSAHALELLTALDTDDFEFRHGTMNDVFLAVTGGEVA